MCTQAHTYTYTNTYTYIHRYIYIHTTYIHTHTNTHAHIHIHIYNPNANNPSPTPNMQLLAGYLQLKLISKSHQNARSNSNIQRNDMMEKSLTHCTVDVMSLATFICNENLLSSCPTKTNMNKRGFSQA